MKNFLGVFLLLISFPTLAETWSCGLVIYNSKTNTPVQAQGGSFDPHSGKPMKIKAKNFELTANEVVIEGETYIGLSLKGSQSSSYSMYESSAKHLVVGLLEAEFHGNANCHLR